MLKSKRAQKRGNRTRCQDLLAMTSPVACCFAPPLLLIVLHLWHVQLFAASQSQSQVASHRYYPLRDTHTHTYTPLHHARSSAVISQQEQTQGRRDDGGRKRSQKKGQQLLHIGCQDQRLPKLARSLSLSLSLTRKCQVIPLEAKRA